MKNISINDLESFAVSVLQKYGYPRPQAEITARVLVEADARGIPSHGVARLAFYRKNIEGNYAFPLAEPEIVSQTPVSAIIDGHNGIGPYIADSVMRTCIEKAEQTGVAFGSVKNSNHFGIAGYWAEMAAKHDMAGIALTNTRKCGIATFGRERLLGTNPIAFAFPTTEGEPFLLDMATTTVAHGKIEVYHRRDKKMPEGWAVDENGHVTTDAHHVEELFGSEESHGAQLYLGGEGELLGGHKGYGLGLMVELLSSALSMGRWSRHTFEGEGSGITHFFGVFRLDIFGNKEDIKAYASSILKEIRESEKAPGQDRIYIHGEKEAENRKRSETEGISVDEATCDLLKGYAAEFKLPDPFRGKII